MRGEWQASGETISLPSPTRPANPYQSPPYIEYISFNNPHPIIAADFRFNPNGDSEERPDLLKVTLTFGGIVHDPVFYDASETQPGDSIRISLLADASTLDTGSYEYSMSFLEYYHYDTPEEETVPYNPLTGTRMIRNHAQSAFGNRFGLMEYDVLDIEDEVGIAWLQGNSGGVYFEYDSGSSSYIAEDGYFGSLTVDGNDSITITDSYQNQTIFDFEGRLRQETDANGNSRYLAYADVDDDGSEDEIAYITDALGRTTTFYYDLNEVTVDQQSESIPQVASIVDFAGRETLFAYDGLYLDSVTQPDPDGAGGQSAPVTTYDYNGDGLLSEIIDPLGHSTTFEYSNDSGLVSSISNDLEQDVDVAPYLAIGLVDLATDTSSGSSPLEVTYTEQVTSTTTDQATGQVTNTRYDKFGQPLSQTDDLGNTFTWERDQHGRVTSMTIPDPDDDGVTNGPLGDLTTAYEWGSCCSSVEKITYPDTSFEEWEHDSTYHQTTSYIDEEGRTVLYEVDSGSGRTTEMRVVMGTGDDRTTMETDDLVTSYTYTTGSGDLPAGLMLSVTDPEGRITTLEYYDTPETPEFGWVETIIYADGTADEASVSYEYDVAGNITAIVDEIGRRTEMEYDAYDRLIELTLPDPDDTGPLTSPVSSYTYDAYGNLTSEIDAEGNTTSYQYDELNRLVKVTAPDPDGVGGLDAPEVTTTFDDQNNKVTITDPLDRDTVYQFDDANRLVSITAPDPDGITPFDNAVITYVYGSAGNLLSEEDTEGNITSYTYDNRLRVSKVTYPDPDGGGGQSSPEVEYTYYDNGDLHKMTDALDRVTEYEYDDAGRLVTIILPDLDGAGGDPAPEITYTYDKAGNVLTVTDPEGNVTTNTYDARHRLKTVTQPDPDGGGTQTASVTIYAYDDANQLTSVTDPLSRVTTLAYDDLGRLLTLTQPDPDGGGGQTSPVTSYTYDAVGNMLTVTDPLSHVTTYGYDDLYRHTSIIDANSDTTTFTYDLVGNLSSLTDPENNTTEWEYDQLNRVSTETITLDSTPISRTYEYDLVGNLVEKVDRNGRTIEYEYDDLYRLTAEKWYDLTPSLVNTISFEYNVGGELLTANDGSSGAEYDYQYDDHGRVTQSLFTLDSRTAQFDYEYDAMNMTGKSATLDSTLDFENAYAYDDVHRLVSLTQTGQMGGNLVADKHVTFVYNAAHQRTDLLRYADDEAYAPNLVIDTSYDYDDIGRLTQIDHTDGTSTIHKFDFTYDASSRIDTIDSSVDGLFDYTYDDTNQLTKVEDDVPNTLESYAYDDNGNRTGGGYSTGAYNRLLSDGTYDYEYDNEGNRIRRVHGTSGATTVYKWDHRNRLVAVIDYADETDADADEDRLQTVDHLFDAYNQWIAKTLDADGDGMGAAIDEFYVYDNGQIVFRLDDSGDIINRYLWDPTAVDQLLADEAIGDELRWSLTDHLGSVHDLVDNAGNVDKHVEFDSFGNVTADSAPAIDMLFWFTGRALDDDTGEQNNLHRWYNSAIGRWSSEDPLGFLADDSNLARYVSNSPGNYTDPTGLDRYLIRQGGHWAIVVEQWGVQADGTTFVAGYTQLNYNCLGFDMFRAVPTGPGNKYYSVLGPVSQDDTIVYRYESTVEQDLALLNQWAVMTVPHNNAGLIGHRPSITAPYLYFVGYFGGITCYTMSIMWIRYGGVHGEAGEAEVP